MALLGIDSLGAQQPSTTDALKRAAAYIETLTPDERAEWIGAVSKTAEMVELLLDALDRLRLSLEAGHQPSAGDLQRLREHSALWRQQLDRLRQRIS
jgi:hypothetical protein